MVEQLEDIQHPSPNGHQGELSVPQLFLTSRGAGWDDLAVYAYHEPMQTLHVHLSSALMARVAQEVADCDPARLTLVGRAPFQDPLLAQVDLALRREVEQPTSAGKLYAQSAAQMLAVHLLRSYTNTRMEIKEPSQGLTRRQISRVTDFVLAHLDQDLSLPVLAQQVGFSPYHFARLFHRTTGESPHQFVLHQRIERAKHLLREDAALAFSLS